MPLPKSSSIAAKATEVYSEVWSIVLQQVWSMPPSRSDDLSELSCLLPYLRQLLTCCACAGLLEDAMISLSCGHCYCCQCQFRDPLLKIQCRQCRERTGLVIETQLRILVQCYRQLCCILVDRVQESPVLLKQLSCANRPDIINDNDTSSSLGEHGEIKMSSSKLANSKRQGNKNKTPKDEKKVPGTLPVVSNPDFNPISEILREIQDGTKVSRAVLVIKPPSKYLNVKVAVTPKKGQQSLGVSTRTTRPKQELSLPNISPESPVGPTSFLSGQEADRHDLRMSNPTRNCVFNRKKQLGRKPHVFRNLNLSEDLPSVQVKKICDDSAHTVTVKEASTEEEEEEEDIDILSVSEVYTHHASEWELTQAKIDLDSFESDVSLCCLNEHYLNISPQGISLKQGGDEDIVTCTTSQERQLRFTMTSEGKRERLCNHLCPKVRVRRSRASIDKMYLQLVKVAINVGKSQSKVLQAPAIFHGQTQMPVEQVEEQFKEQFEEKFEDHTLVPELETALPDDIAEILEELESENPYPFERQFFHNHPIFPPPFFPLPIPPHGCPPPMLGPHHHQSPFPIVVSAVPLKHPYSPTVLKPPPIPRKRRTPGFSEDGWRCRCGTNNVMFPEKVCAKGKCPCFSKGIPCKNCLCKYCHNPNNNHQ